MLCKTKMYENKKQTRTDLVWAIKLVAMLSTSELAELQDQEEGTCETQDWLRVVVNILSTIRHDPSPTTNTSGWK